MNVNVTNLIKEYEFQTQRVHGKKQPISYSNGWFTLGAFGGLRFSDIQHTVNELKKEPTVSDRIEYVNGIATVVKAHQHVVKHLLNGSDVVEDRDTPLCCSVSSETYWSM